MPKPIFLLATLLACFFSINAAQAQTVVLHQIEVKEVGNQNLKFQHSFKDKDKIEDDGNSHVYKNDTSVVYWVCPACTITKVDFGNFEPCEGGVQPLGANLGYYCKVKTDVTAQPKKNGTKCDTTSKHCYQYTIYTTNGKRDPEVIVDDNPVLLKKPKR